VSVTLASPVKTPERIIKTYLIAVYSFAPNIEESLETTTRRSKKKYKWGVKNV